MAALACCGIIYLGDKFLDMVKHITVSQKYSYEQRDEEAHQEELEMERDLSSLFGVGCPLLCCIFIGLWVALAFWIWGVVVAAKNSHGTCGAGPPVFWILFAVMVCANMCVIRCISSMWPSA